MSEIPVRMPGRGNADARRSMLKKANSAYFASQGSSRSGFGHGISQNTASTAASTSNEGSSELGVDPAPAPGKRGFLQRAQSQSNFAQGGRRNMLKKSASQSNVWWQTRVLRKAPSMVEECVLESTVHAPFLNDDSYKGRPIALFRRNEIQVGRLLGEGSFAEVYEVLGFQVKDASKESDPERIRLIKTVMDDNEEPSYALKHLKLKLLKKGKDFHMAAADLVVETRFLTKLNHPNILKVRGSALNGIQAYAIGYDGFFALCDRLTETLYERIRTWRSDDEFQEKARAGDTGIFILKSDYARQIASALSYLHERRIIFRDLKPQNLGFLADDRIQLFDFGLAREMPPPSSVVDDILGLYDMSGAGTRRYMAGEIFTTGHYNLKADVYSWSMVFYEILTETRPYSKFSSEDHQLHVCVRGERPSLSKTNIPTPIRYLLRRSWARSIAKRFNMEEALEVTETVIADMREDLAETEVLKEETEEEVKEEVQDGKDDDIPKEVSTEVVVDTSAMDRNERPAGQGASVRSGSQITGIDVDVGSITPGVSDVLDLDLDGHESLAGTEKIDKNMESTGDLENMSMGSGVGSHKSIATMGGMDSMRSTDGRSMSSVRTLDRTINPHKEF